MATTGIYVVTGLFVLGIIIILVLFGLKVGPYGDTYAFRNPRTWKSEPDNTSWLTPTYDYGTDDRNVPTPDIKNVYCEYDPNRCIPNQASFTQKGVPTSC